MTKISVRNASPGDEETIVRFHRALYITHRDQVIDQRLLPLIDYQNFDNVLAQDVHSLLANSEKFVFVAELDEEKIGYITGHVEHEPRRVLQRRGVIGDWFVVPEARQHGVGKRLLSHLEDNFVRHGCEAIESATWAFNESGKRAHDALGFDEIQITYRKKLGENIG